MFCNSWIMFYSYCLIVYPLVNAVPGPWIAISVFRAGPDNFIWLMCPRKANICFKMIVLKLSLVSLCIFTKVLNSVFYWLFSFPFSQFLIVPAIVGSALLHRLSDDCWEKITAWIYGMGLCALFIVSTVFHIVSWKKSHLRYSGSYAISTGHRSWLGSASCAGSLWSREAKK